MAGGIDGIALGAIAAGGLFLYAAVNGKTVLGTIQALIKGQSPASGPSTGAASLSGGYGQSAGGGSAPSQGYSIATNIPAAKGSYSQAQLQKLWTDNGGPADTAAFAAAVAMAESSGNPKAQSPNPDGGTNYGLFQLDTKGVGAGYPPQDLMDPNLNTQLTIMATNGGVNWQEWGDQVTAAVGYHYTPGSAVP